MAFKTEHVPNTLIYRDMCKLRVIRRISSEKFCIPFAIAPGAVDRVSIEIPSDIDLEALQEKNSRLTLYRDDFGELQPY